MRKRVQVALAVLLVVFAGVIAWQVLRLREPVYQGKRLSFWLERLTGAVNRRNQNERDGAEQALRHIGTNALPVLIERLTAQDGRLKQLMTTLGEKHKLLPFHLKSAEQRRIEAVCGYEALGPLASDQVSRLIDMLDHDPFLNARQAAARDRAVPLGGPAAGQSDIMLGMRNQTADVAFGD